MVANTLVTSVETTDGAVIHCETLGQPSPSRPTLIFLHYYGGSPATYFEVVPHLKGFHCVLYHSRGWSPSTGPEDPEQTLYGIERLSSDLEAVIKATCADSHAGYVLVGHSMGAKVVQHYAASKSSHLLRGIVLLAPAPLFGLAFPPEAKAQQLAAYQSEEAVRFVLKNVLTAGGLSEEVTRKCVADSMRGNNAATAAWPTYVAQEDYAGLQSQIKVPVLVMRGDKDFEREMLGLTLGDELGWKNVTVEDCGHLIPLEQPQKLVEAILSFVSGL